MITAVIHTAKTVVKLKHEKNSGLNGFKPMTSAILVQKIGIVKTRLQRPLTLGQVEKHRQ